MTKIYAYNKKKSFNYVEILISLFVFLFIVTTALKVLAQDYQDAYSAVENLSAEIRMNDGAVGQTLTEAIYAEHGQFDKWQKLDEKMNELGRSIDKNIPEISKNLAILRKTNPEYGVPHIEIRDIFSGNLDQVKEKKRQLSELSKSENQKIHKINQMLSKINRDLQNATRGYLGAALEGFMPDEISLAGEGTIIVLGAYFGPPGIAAAGVAWAATGTFNSLVNLYYNSQGLAEQTKILTDMVQGLQKRKAELENNLKTLMDARKEMDQIEQILITNDKKIKEYKQRIIKAQAEWKGQSDAAMEDRKKKMEEEIKKRLAEQKDYKGEVVLCNGVRVIFDPKEYKNEIDKMINQMDSYSKAVDDGGDPDNFSILVIDWHNKISEDFKKVNEDYRKKSEALNSTSISCYNAAGKFDEDWWKRYCGCIISAQTAQVNASKEYTKISSIHWRVREAMELFKNRITDATKRRTIEFWNLYNLWERRFDDVNSKTYNSVSGIPYWIDQWQARAEKIDENVQLDLSFGKGISDIVNELSSTATYLKDLDKTVKESIKAYEEADTQRKQISNQAKSELTSFLNKWSRLVGYYYDPVYFPWLGERAEFVPHSQDVADGIKRIEETIRNKFKTDEPENVKIGKKINLLGIAEKYENKAKELAFYTDWINTYRHRLENAANTLSRISWEKTKKGFYGATDPNRLEKELGEPPWSNISKEAAKLISKEDYNKYISASGDIEKLGPGRTLVAAQQLIQIKLNNEARYYVQIRSNKGFQPVSATVINPLIEKWKTLKQICEQYDNLVKPVRDEIEKLPEEVEKIAQQVFETYNKMPKISRDAVYSEHIRFSNAYRELYNYLTRKLEALRPTLVPPTNNLASTLDDLLLNYPELLAKWQKERDEENKRMEEAQKRYEAEQKRLEAERKKKEEEAKKQADMSVAAVKEMYVKFKNAYESKNDSLIISFLSKSWQSTDGTSISEIQRNLKNSFRIFDEVKWDIQNLSIQPQGENTYQVIYDLTITGRIYKRNIKHEEKSRVTERVILDKNGKAYIESTLDGRFWSIN